MLAEVFETQTNLGEWLQESLGISASVAAIVVAIASVFVVVMLTVAIDRLLGWSIRSLTPWIIDRFETNNHAQWLDAVRERFVARRGAHIVAALAVYWMIPLALRDFPETLSVVQNLIEGYMVIVIVIAINSLLRASGDVLFDDDLPSGLSLGFASQGAQVMIWAVGLVIAASAVFDTSVSVLLSGLAGMTAVTLLVFRDSILGFVAGVQFASNDILRIGDWIEVPQHGAYGIVTDIALTTVKIENFDKTISTVPTYSLVSGSFRNWRGMKESGARRICRSISIDMRSIGFVTEDQLVGLQKIEILRPFLEERQNEIESFNSRFTEEARVFPNTRQLTNIGVFRAYVEMYLEHHSAMRDDMTRIVRQLAPTPDGLPIEIIVFCKEQKWSDFERVQADLFDHVISILPNFRLTIFQLDMPAGHIK